MADVTVFLSIFSLSVLFVLGCFVLMLIILATHF